MTAEVAILNREAVALAADSAVTLTGPEGRKIYNTANKLFPLSLNEPIAVMVYGSGNFGLTPWETIVKEYRRNLGSNSYSRVEDYADDFIQKLPLFIDPNEQYRRIFETAIWELDNIRKSVKIVLLQRSIKSQRLGKNVIRDEIIAQIEARINELSWYKSIEEISEVSAGKQIKLAVGDWRNFVDECLGDLPSSEKIRQRAKALVRASLRVASPFSSGVVVVGFGTSQLFPALLNYEVDGVTGGKIRVRLLKDIKIGEEDPKGVEWSAFICPFAQVGMIETFINGIHPEYHQVLEDFVDEVIVRFTERFGVQVKRYISTSTHSSLLKEMAEVRSEVVESFQDRLGGYLKDQYSDPIMSIVNLLPKEELAELAESLISLTSLRRRVTPEDEDVGGPIDVAVISKGDGLIWIKRKHYFSSELNLRYLNRNLNPAERKLKSKRYSNPREDKQCLKDLKSHSIKSLGGLLKLSEGIRYPRIHHLRARGPLVGVSLRRYLSRP